MGNGSGKVKSILATAWVYRVGAWALLSVALAIAAPYGEEMQLGLWGRLGYWTSINALAILLALGVRHVIVNRFPKETLGVLLSIAVVQALVLGLTVWLVNIHVFGFALHGAAWLAELMLIMLLVALCVAMIRYEVARIRSFAALENGSIPAKPARREGPSRPAFLDRMDPPLDGQVLAVSAADHYLDIVTTKGRGRVLMRFRDALAELEGVPGFRLHRSHWVAASEVVRVRPDGRRHVADLRSGKALPVSDAYIDDLRAAGLVDDGSNGSLSGGIPASRISALSPKRRDTSGRSQNMPPV